MNFDSNRFARKMAAPQRPAAAPQAFRPFGLQPQGMQRPPQPRPAQTLQRPPMQQRAPMQMQRPMAPPPPKPRMAAPMQRPPMGAPPPKPPMAQPRQPGSMGGALSGGMGGAVGAMMSDQRSKERIRELEDLNDTYAALLDPPAAKPTPRAPDVAALDRAEQFKNVGAHEYSYKNPERHGQGRFAGPMAHELKGIPGVVKPTPEGDMVDPGRLSLATASVVGQQQRELDELKSDYEALMDEDIDYPKLRRPAL